MNEKNDISHILQQLGLNNLEAEVYQCLLSTNGVTAYKIGKQLNKPTANVYKAIDRLTSLGAVMTEAGENTLCVAVSPEEFLDNRIDAYSNLADKAKKKLAKPEPVERNEGVYNIRSAELAISKAIEMINNAQQIIVLDVFPQPLEILLPHIQNAANNGIEVYLQSYEKVKTKKIKQVVTEGSQEVIKFWSSQQLNLVCDGNSSLLALFNRSLTQIYQCYWSRSLYISCMNHMGFMREHLFHRLFALDKEQELPTKVMRMLNKHKVFHKSSILGQVELFDKYSITR